VPFGPGGFRHVSAVPFLLSGYPGCTRSESFSLEFRGSGFPDAAVTYPKHEEKRSCIRYATLLLPRGFRMPLPKVIPALADLTQDIAGAIPVHLLHDWATGERDLFAAYSVLSSFEIQGTVVSSDTSGLSRMTRERDLLDVLSLISQPKEILHALGREIGGRAIGTWVADNTEMFYPAGLDADTVVDAMGEVQFRIQERLQIRIGMCIHPGRFYEIGGGLYGGDAYQVEYLAEQCAGPGEILLTESAVRSLKTVKSDDLYLKTFPHEDSQEQAYLLRSNRRASGLQEREPLYPHPFPPDFFEILHRFQEPGDVEALKRKIYEQWLRECVVVFLAREREPQEARSLTGLLDDLVINALMDTVIRETMPGTDHIASSGGGIAILTFDHPTDAVDFVRAVHIKLAENGLPVQVGIDAGPVLLFQNSRGPSGIAGDPINIASKLAEDVGRPGCICVTEKAFQRLGDSSEHERFEVTVSGVALKGFILT